MYHDHQKSCESQDKDIEMNLRTMQSCVMSWTLDPRICTSMGTNIIGKKRVWDMGYMIYTLRMWKYIYVGYRA